MPLLKVLKRSSEAINDLFFPPICVSCGNHLFKSEVEICAVCMRRLPRTYFEKCPYDNAMSAILWGRCHIEHAYALFFYKKGERVQQLLHEVKYRGNTKLGHQLGVQLGKTIKSYKNAHYDYIIPIPLHPKKEKLRGYNQAAIIADGIEESTQTPVNTMAVKRNIHTSSQTRKGRYERWQNVKDIFLIVQPEELRNKHILLVDDVITTGSTLEACINQIKTIEGTKVSIATIACASI